MRRLVWLAVVAACCSCSSPPPPDPADVHFLDALHRAKITLFTSTGINANDHDAIEIAKNICDRVRHEPRDYDPILYTKHEQVMLDDSQARALDNMAMENYCPALLH